MGKPCPSSEASIPSLMPRPGSLGISFKLSGLGSAPLRCTRSARPGATAAALGAATCGAQNPHPHPAWCRGHLGHRLMLTQAVSWELHQKWGSKDSSLCSYGMLVSPRLVTYPAEPRRWRSLPWRISPLPCRAGDSRGVLGLGVPALPEQRHGHGVWSGQGWCPSPGAAPAWAGSQPPSSLGWHWGRSAGPTALGAPWAVGPGEL